MYQRNMCPTVGLLRRSLTADVCSVFNGSSRAFSVSAKRAEEPSAPVPAASAAPANPASRKARSALALDQITRLQARIRVSPKPAAPTEGAARPANGLRITREAYDSPAPRAARGGAPNGPMVRAPANLRLRTATPRGPGESGGPRGPGGPGGPVGPGRPGRTGGPGGPGGRPGGPNLRGREKKGGDEGRGDRGPKKREKRAGGEGERQTAAADVPPETTLSDGMVQHLLRVQRKEWDRVPYEPKYTTGSFAANELIYAGRELFKGEVPPVKVWGPLEKRIGVVGMFGAEAHLKVKRVLDGDDAPFGQEEPYAAQVEEAPEAKAAEVPEARAQTVVQ